MDVRLVGLLADQHDLVARWQLIEAGWEVWAIEYAAVQRRWRAIHPGVYATNHAPLTREQRWMAATLTAPDSVLSHASAAACHGFRPYAGSYETLTRPGNRGPQRSGGVLVSYSTNVELIRRGGVPITPPARTLIDLAPHLDERALAKAVREAIRLKLVTVPVLQQALSEHRGRRGTRFLGELTARYATLPIERTRSDAEAYALERLARAHIRGPEVNRRIAGEEADLVWPDERLIIEIDGPQYHLDPEEDRRKQERWEQAGWRVERLPSDGVFATEKRR